MQEPVKRKHGRPRKGEPRPNPDAPKAPTRRELRNNVEVIAPAVTEDLMLLDVEGVCRLTSLSKGGLYRMIANKRFPAPLKLGRRAVWRRPTISKFLSQLEAQAA